MQHPRRRKHLVFGGLLHRPLFVYGVIVICIICSLFLKQQVKKDRAQRLGKRKARNEPRAAKKMLQTFRVDQVVIKGE